MAFLAPEDFWLITVERGSLDDFAETAQIVLLGDFINEKGTPDKYVVAFSDGDLADQFVADRLPEGHILFPFHYPNAGGFIQLADHLKGNGNEWIGFDPERRGDAFVVSVVTIDEIVVAMRSRKSPNADP